MTPLLEAAHLTWRVHDVAIVNDVSLSVSPGEVLGIVGPNGAGKSSLVRLLSGELRPHEGEVRIDGRPLREWRRRDLALRRAVLPQQAQLRFAFTALQVVLMGRFPHSVSADTADDIAIAERSLSRVDALYLRDRIFPTLSGGEQARVCLARVLAQETPLIFLDEPTAALDIRHQHRVTAIARELANEGRAVVIVLHDLNLAASLDSVIVMREGRIVCGGPPTDILSPETLTNVFDYPVSVITGADGLPVVIPARTIN
jgi:iron complex transport system ATP-binding protein